jgi:hypothetical protein
MSAALVPVTITLAEPGWVPAALGALVVVVEGFQGAFKLHDNWLSYRGAHEALVREKYLFLAHADGYASPQKRHRLLAEQVEAISGQENVSWVKRLTTKDEG